MFEEATSNAGISYAGETFGVCWGDFDGDGFPDIWVNNHASAPSLYLNNGNGSFSEISSQVWSANPDDDTHGCEWIDYDNDGDQDLNELTGALAGTGNLASHMFVNDSGLLIDQASALGIDYSFGRGRTPLWFDYDRDGLNDVLIATILRSDMLANSTLFRNTGNGFVNVNATVGFATQIDKNVLSAQLSDINDDGSPDVVLQNYTFPYKIFDTATIPFTNITSYFNLSNTYNVNDLTIADVNGDTLPDILLATNSEGSDVIQKNVNRIELYLKPVTGEHGISFSATANTLYFTLYNDFYPLETIFIGSDGHHPSDYTVIGKHRSSFSVSLNDASNNGVKSHVAGVDNGLYIGFDVAIQRWKVLATHSGGAAIEIILESDVSLSNVNVIGFNPNLSQSPNKLFIHTGTGFTDSTVSSGLGQPDHGSSVVAGDFDNDMDIDIYYVRTGNVDNITNILYENQGNGTFISVANAGGAEGSSLGRGESVAMADYDNDGFLDLFITNGDQFGLFSEDGPHQLFHNIGNANNWIEIDLEGTLSNRDGIGAKVLVTAGGIQQMREQGGGMHFRSQNDKRIHFGMGSNTVIDTLEVHWPSGIVQTLTNVNVNQILHIVESDGSTPTPTPVISPTPTTSPVVTPTPIISPTPIATVTPIVSPTPTATPDASLVAYYAFETGSGTVAVDSSGNGNDGAINGGTVWTVGTNGIGGGLDFNGVDAFVDIGDIDLTDAFTIAAWIKPSSLGIKSAILGKAFETYQLYLSPQNSIVFQSNSATQLNYNAGLVADTWHHVAVTFDTIDGMALYVDGVIVDVDGTTQILNTNNVVTKIGATGFTPKNFFSGTMDEVRIYNRALMFNEIQGLLNTAAPTPTPAVTPSPVISPTPVTTVTPIVSPSPTATPDVSLLAYYAFETGNGTVAVDSSGNGNNGAINGGAAWTAGANEIGGGLNFNGIDAFVDIGDIDLTNAFTIAAWIKPSILGTKSTILGKTFQTYQLYLSPQNSFVFQSNSATQLNYNAGLVADMWYHVAVTFNSIEGMTLYVDGSVAVTNSSATQIITTNNVVTKIGATEFVPKNFFAGTMDEVRIYNRVLTVNEIQELSSPTPALAATSSPVISPTPVATASPAITPVTSPIAH